MAQRGRGTTRSEDAQGTPTQSRLPPSILVYEGTTAEHVRLRDIEVRVSGFGIRVWGTRYGSGVGAKSLPPTGGYRGSGCRARLSKVLRVSGFGFRISGFGFRVLGLGFRVSGFGFRVSGFGFRVLGFSFKDSESGLRDSGIGIRGAGVRSKSLLPTEGEQM